MIISKPRWHGVMLNDVKKSMDFLFTENEQNGGNRSPKIEFFTGIDLDHSSANLQPKKGENCENWQI